MLTHWRRERFIRKTLMALAKQRVALILQPGNVWVTEYAPSESVEQVAEALRTCDLRGWAEVVSNAVPQAQLKPGGKLPASLAGVAPVYRLTEAGWAQVRRTHQWLVATFIASLIAAIAAVATLFQLK
jgi:hypothetical protein